MKYLIVGLGNIGAEYNNTRHNIGFNIVDAIAQELDAKFSIERHAIYSNTKYKGKQIHLIKPTTYMNLSGKALKFWMNELKINQENVLVIVDDLALPFGQIRLKGKGTHAGHNGLKDIEAVLTNNQYPRLRFGIGNNFSKGKQVDFVLGKWSDAELKQLEERVNIAKDAALSFCTDGLNNTMNKYNNI
ncbi:MAG: aminoacyl-tRNA hydrolase [Chitinophagales bacterium]|nr:aminoacyl-tRNA hydrolase [Chitinophagales bacterium]